MRPSARPEAVDAAQQRRALERAEERVRTLTRQLEAAKVDLSAMDQKRRETVSRHEDLERDHDKLVGQHDSLRALVAVRAERIRELERLVEARDAELRQVKHDHEALAASHAADVERLREEMRAEKQRGLELIQALQEEQLRLQTRPPAPARDDLRRLKGVGPKFEKALHALGISRFAQIAAWTDDDVSAYATKLKTNVKRIHRDQWIESARSLADASSTAHDSEAAASGVAAAAPAQGTIDSIPPARAQGTIDSIPPPNDEVEGSW